MVKRREDGSYTRRDGSYTMASEDVLCMTSNYYDTIFSISSQCFQFSHSSVILQVQVQRKLNIDHIFTGHYMYAEGNDGYRGDRARMGSIVFMTKVNQSLTFYYHMYFEDQYTSSGGFQIATKEELSDVENIIWFSDKSTGEPWKFGCFNLPSNQNLSLIFIANRHPSAVREADIAVDDISLKDEVCSDSECFILIFLIHLP